MKLERYALIAEIVGAAAIVLSLIFVGLQVRENTRVTSLTSDRAIDQQNLALNLAITNSGDFSEILIRGESNRRDLSQSERARFDNYSFSRFGAYENIVGNYLNGLLTDEQFQVWTQHFRDRFIKPGYRDFWLEYRSGYFPEFRVWADEQLGVAPQ